MWLERWWQAAKSQRPGAAEMTIDTKHFYLYVGWDGFYLAIFGGWPLPPGQSWEWSLICLMHTWKEEEDQ